MPPGNPASASATERLVALSNAAAANSSEVDHAMARCCLLDWLGVTIAGAFEPVAEILAADAELGSEGFRGTLVGRGGFAAERDAVLINGAAGHALDFDDGMAIAMVHPSVVIFPGLLAMACRRDTVLGEVLGAFVSGAEAAGRIGMMMEPDHYARGFHATGTVGAMAAASAISWLAGLGKAQQQIAIGLAGTRAAGLKASFGTDAKPLHAGWAALIGFTAADWAQRGMTGAIDILGSQQGICQVQSESADPERGLVNLDSKIIHHIKIKCHAACGATHAAIDGIRELLAGGQLPIDRIARIRLDVPRASDKICNNPTPSTGLELKFSFKGVAAMTVLGIDTANIENYTTETAIDPDVLRAMQLIEVNLVDDIPLGRSRVAIELTDGRTIETKERTMLQEADLTVLGERVARKFESLATPRLGSARTRELRDAVLGGRGSLSMRRIAELSTPPAA